MIECRSDQRKRSSCAVRASTNKQATAVGASPSNFFPFFAVENGESSSPHILRAPGVPSLVIVSGKMWMWGWHRPWSVLGRPMADDTACHSVISHRTTNTLRVEQGRGGGKATSPTGKIGLVRGVSEDRLRSVYHRGTNVSENLSRVKRSSSRCLTGNA